MITRGKEHCTQVFPETSVAERVFEEEGFFVSYQTINHPKVVKLPDQRSGLPGEVLGRFHIASLDPDQRSELAGSRPVNGRPLESMINFMLLLFKTQELLVRKL